MLGLTFGSTAMYYLPLLDQNCFHSLSDLGLDNLWVFLSSWPVRTIPSFSGVVSCGRPG